MSTMRFFPVSWADSKLVTLRAGMPTALSAERAQTGWSASVGAERPLPRLPPTCGQDPRENPALAKAHGLPGDVVLLQDGHAAGPHVRRGAFAVVSRPVPHQHAAIVHGTHLTRDRVVLACVPSPHPQSLSGQAEHPGGTRDTFKTSLDYIGRLGLSFCPPPEKPSLVEQG